MLGEFHHGILSTGHHYYFDCLRMLACSNSNLIVTPHWTAQFQAVGVGLGSIFAGLGGLKIALDWLEQTKLKRKAVNLTGRYPSNLRDKPSGFRVVKTKDRNEWWILDERTNTRHWIRNPETAKDLGLHDESPQEITLDDLKKYPKGEEINTKKL